MFYSVNCPDKIYVGYTTDPKERLKTHNCGGSIHTRKDKPWELVVCMAFKNMNCAKQFENILNHSRAEHLLPKDFGK